MIEITDLVKYYGDKKAIDHISFRVEKGEVLGFLGPNGAGKTTTMNILTGYLSATSGKVTINGRDILEEPSAAKKAIGYLPEKPPLYPEMTVFEYLKYLCELKGVARAGRIRQIAEIMQMVRISDVSARLIRNLSKGYRQRVGIAQALVGNPEVLVLDEPTVGLDPNQIIEIRSLLKSLAKNHTVILSSHILSEVQAVCGRVVIISDGRIAAIDTTEALSRGIGETSNLLLTFEGPLKEVSASVRALPGVRSVDTVSDQGRVHKVSVTYDANADIRKKIFFSLASHSWPILEMRQADPTLEEIFLRVTATDEKKRR